MKIIECLKRMRVIEKRIENNERDITKYASMVSTERPSFKDEKEQKEELQKIVQSNTDLVTEYVKLNNALERTNLTTFVTIGGMSAPIRDFLFYSRKGCRLMINTFRALNDEAATTKMRHVSIGETPRPRVERMYDEKTKNTNMRKWMDLQDSITQSLEVINATTDLIETK
jgi:S-adenosylmethionine synthetase